MAIEKLNEFSFAHGIDSVVYLPPHDAMLPELSTWLPNDMPGSTELGKLLALPHLGDYPAQQLRPQITDTSWLTPHGFQSVLHGAIVSLQQRHRDQPSPQLQAALTLLESQEALRDLVSNYRNAVFLG